MTGIAIGGNLFVFTPGMALAATDGMAPGQREKGMLNVCSTPTGRTRRMTLYAIGGITRFQVIGFGCCQVGVSVTVDALNAEGIEAPHGTRFMASRAIADLMGSREREPALPVNFTDVFNDPGPGGMTPGTIRPQSVFMQIIMTINALIFCGGEFKGFVARPAVDRPVLPLQLKSGAVVIKRHIPAVDLPPGGTVAIGTINFQALPVRRLPVQNSYPKQKA